MKEATFGIDALQADAAAHASSLYIGEVLNECPMGLDFTKAQAVVVSGASWNPCGHMLLCVGEGPDRRYFHVADLYDYPRTMTQAQFERFMKEQRKREIGRQDVALNNPSGAQQKLEELVGHRWLWTAIPHNCVTFAAQILEAGGGHLFNGLNCPDTPGLARAIDVNRIGNAIRYLLRDKPAHGP